MSSRTSLPPLRIEPRPSRTYLWLVSALHLLTLFTILITHSPLLLKLPLLAVVVGYFLILYRGELRLRGRRAVRLALWDGRGQWRIQVGPGALQGARLLPDSLNLTYLVILRFKTDAGAQLSLPLFRDSIDADSHRRLRARLRVYAASLTGSGAEQR